MGGLEGRVRWGCEYIPVSEIVAAQYDIRDGQIEMIGW